MLYGSDELLSEIKRADELTEQEKQWVENEDSELLEL